MSEISPLVSIIIPTFNRAHLIGKTLDSVLAQTYKNWECIVVDDGSTDSTDALMAKYTAKDNRFKYYDRPKNRLPGGNAARNYGFEISKGVFIQWFDSDDIMLEEFIECKIQFFTDEINLVICSGYYWMPENNDMNKIDLKVTSNLYQDFIFWKVPILTPSILFRKSFLSDKILFSDTISRGQETELFSRLFFQLPNQSFKIINVPLFLYRQHLAAKTAKNKDYNFEYKESLAFIHIENFKRSLNINNLEILNYLYRALIILFFTGLEKKHYLNVKYILDNLTPLLRQKNKQLAFKFYFFGKMFLLSKSNSYRIRNYLKKAKLN